MALLQTVDLVGLGSSLSVEIRPSPHSSVWGPRGRDSSCLEEALLMVMTEAQESKPNHSHIFQASASITSAKTPLAQESHVDNFKVKLWRYRFCPEGGQSKWSRGQTQHPQGRKKTLLLRKTGENESNSREGQRRKIRRMGVGRKCFRHSETEAQVRTSSQHLLLCHNCQKIKPEFKSQFYFAWTEKTQIPLLR